MFKRIFTVSMLCLFLSSFVLAQAPKKADEVLKDAYAKSALTHKNVMLIFHATWCGWCTRLENALKSDELKSLMEDNFVIANLDVMESAKDKIEKFENPGGKELMNKLGGEKSGLPFYVFLDKDGNKIADSNVMPKNQNIGYPGSKDEIAEFVKLLLKASSNIHGDAVKTIVDYLNKVAPKQ